MVFKLRALTIEAQSGIQGASLPIESFPFRVGRENRGPYAALRRGTDRRTGDIPATNDLYLWDAGPDYYVSTKHFLIEQDGDDFYLVDRESALGTWVEGKLVGGNRRGGRIKLRSGDVVIPGGYQAGFVFKVEFGNFLESDSNAAFSRRHAHLAATTQQ